ncbi:MAG: nickel ABC transporter permease [bacterium]
MLEYIIRRILMMIPVLLGVSILVFLMIHLIPGDPVELMLGDSAKASDVERLRQDLGLDKPLLVQFGRFLKGLVTGDLGRSLHSRKPVVKILMERFPATIELAVISMLVAILIAIPLGVVSAVKAGTFIDNASMFLTLFSVSIPNFWLGPMLILLFSVTLNLLPVSGKSSPAGYVLPAITLGTSLAAILARMTRTSLLEVLKAQYVTTAYAKGASHMQAIVKHALRNALIPVTTIMGLQFGALLGGSVITETVFSWPGIGRELIRAIHERDYPVVQGCVLLIAFCYVLINLLTDLLYGVLDPRIQFQVSASSRSSRISSIVSLVRRFEKWFPGNIISIVLVTAVLVGGLYAVRTEMPDGVTLLSMLPTLPSALSVIFGWIMRCIVFFVPLILLVIWRRRDPLGWKRFVGSYKTLVGLFLVMLFLFVGLFGPTLVSTDPTLQDLPLRLSKPSLDHWFGMDQLGRDLFSRVIFGARVSIFVGLTVTSISMCFGVLIGMISGMAGGRLDNFIMRIIDIFLAFPGILLAIAMVAVLGPNIRNVTIALCIMGWVGYARLARGQALSIKNVEYIQAARALGAGNARIMFRHVLPNIMAPIIVQATLGMAGVIIAEAGLSFLGLGVQPPAPSWGGILTSGVDYFPEGAHITILPGLAIMLVVLGFNFLGDGLRDAFDPRMR